jgi:hypothetical protein
MVIIKYFIKNNFNKIFLICMSRCMDTMLYPLLLFNKFFIIIFKKFIYIIKYNYICAYT